MNEIIKKQCIDLIVGLNEIRVSKFKKKILREIDDEIDDIQGTISNEHLCELGFEGEGLNYHTTNIEFYTKYLERIKALKSAIESVLECI